jgi:hypothetical protein
MARPVVVSFSVTFPPEVETEVAAGTSAPVLLSVAVTVTDPLAGVTVALTALAETTELDDVESPVIVVAADAADEPVNAVRPNEARASRPSLPRRMLRLMFFSPPCFSRTN